MIYANTFISHSKCYLLLKTDHVCVNFFVFKFINRFSVHFISDSSILFLIFCEIASSEEKYIKCSQY